LVSPDYAANYQGALFSQLVSGDLHAKYDELLMKVKSGGYSSVMFIGDKAIPDTDLTPSLSAVLGNLPFTVFVGSDAESALAASSKYIIPSRSILERSGLLINGKGRVQYTDRVVEPLLGTEPEWRIINRLCEKFGSKLISATTDREATLSLLSSESRLAGLTISMIKAGGVDLNSHSSGSTDDNTRAAGQV